MTLSFSFRDTLNTMIEKSQTGAKLVWDAELAGTSGQYRALLNEIALNEANISRNAANFRLKTGCDISDEDYGYIILAHELGHAFDNPLRARNDNRIGLRGRMQKICLKGDERRFKRYYKRLSRLTMFSEKKAWALAPQFYPETVDKCVAKRVESYCLQSYINEIRHKYLLYLMTARLMPTLKRTKGFFPNVYHFHFDFIRGHRFRVDTPNKRIHIPLNHYYARSRMRLYPVKSVPFILFETMFDYLKWKDRVELVAIEKLEEAAYVAHANEKDADKACSLMDDYGLRMEAWYEQSFEAMRPYLSDWSEAFDAYTSHILKKNQRQTDNVKKLYSRKKEETVTPSL